MCDSGRVAVGLQPPAPLETAPVSSGAVSDGPPRQRSGAPPSHLQPVDQGPAFRLARKGLPHGRSRQSSEGPQRSAGPAQRVDGRDRPCVVNALRAKRGPYPAAPRTGLNPPHLSFRRTSILPTDSAEDPNHLQFTHGPSGRHLSRLSSPTVCVPTLSDARRRNQGRIRTPLTANRSVPPTSASPSAG